MTAKPPASVALSEMNIPHDLYTHDGPIRSIGQAAAERNQDVSQIIRSILFRLSEQEYALVLVAGPNQISWRSLRRHFRQSRLTMATPEEVLKVTGFEIGAVSPFGLQVDIPIIVDRSVFAQPAVSLGSGVQGTAILITTKNLKKALGEVEVGRFSKPL
jgi:Cys-tRNA(Pro) deacylase